MKLEFKHNHYIFSSKIKARVKGTTWVFSVHVCRGIKVAYISSWESSKEAKTLKILANTITIFKGIHIFLKYYIGKISQKNSSKFGMPTVTKTLKVNKTKLSMISSE